LFGNETTSQLPGWRQLAQKISDEDAHQRNFTLLYIKTSEMTENEIENRFRKS